MRDDTPGLPRSWARITLAQAAVPRGEKASPVDHSAMPFIGMDHVQAQTGRIIGSVPAGTMKSAAAQFKAGDVLYGRLRPYLNKVAIPSFDGLASAEFLVFPETDLVLAAYLAYRLRSHDFVNFASHLNEGDRPRVDFAQISAFVLDIPPLREQRRIVARIDELFSELDKAVESLTLARAQLKIYRQALLKAAFEGKLTADWRAANPDTLEPPETLLARIRVEREARYKQALARWPTAVAEWRASGEVGRKPAKPSRWADIPNASTVTLDDGWLAVPLDFLIGDMQQGWSPTCDGRAEVGEDAWAIVKTTAVQHGHYNDRAIKLFPADLQPRPEIEIEPGDFLMTRKGPRVRTGVVCLVRQTRPRIMLCDTVYRFRCDENLIFAPLLELALNAPDTMRELDSLKAGISESGISLNHGKVRSVAIQFPGNLDEQIELVRLLEARITQIEHLETEITVALARLAALRQSILKKAFSGQLVPQDPTDEPAAALLARLREQALPARIRRRTTA